MIGAGTAPKPSGRAVAPGLDFALSGGAGWAAPRDLNDGAVGVADHNGASLGLPALGSVRLLHLTTLAGLELSYRLSDRLALGLGVDFFWGERKSRIEYTDGVLSEALVTRPSVRAVLVNSRRAFTRAGAFTSAAASASISSRPATSTGRSGFGSWEQWKGTADGKGLGGEAAAIELDVYALGDRVVVIHDDTLDRTTDGRGPIVGRSFNELRSLDAGKGERVPLLEEVLDVVAGRVAVNVELKGRGTARTVARTIAHRPDTAFLVSSFDHRELAAFRTTTRSVPVAPLFDRNHARMFDVATGSAPGL